MLDRRFSEISLFNVPMKEFFKSWIDTFDFLKLKRCIFTKPMRIQYSVFLLITKLLGDALRFLSNGNPLYFPIQSNPKKIRSITIA